MKQIIVVDDDAATRQLFYLILQRAGYNVVLYPNAEPLMSGEYILPHIFIIDKQLPGISGLEVCHYLKSRKSTKDIPVIIISASPHVATYAAEAGANDFIEKPFKVKDLLSLLEKY